MFWGETECWQDVIITHFRRPLWIGSQYTTQIFQHLFHQGPHIPCGWSVKLVDIFLAPINLWFDSQFRLSSFIVFLNEWQMDSTTGNRSVVSWCFLASLFSSPVNDHWGRRRCTSSRHHSILFRRLMQYHHLLNCIKLPLKWKTRATKL